MCSGTSIILSLNEITRCKMWIAESIAPHLPYLRRYARSLTRQPAIRRQLRCGGARNIDCGFRAFDRSIAPRVALYRTFTKVWNSLAVNRVSDDMRQLDKPLAERRLDSITPLPRQAFLLVSVEGFSTAEAAQVLDVTPAQ